MTPIQAQSLPAILKGRDLLAQAKTGSGENGSLRNWHIAHTQGKNVPNTGTGTLPNA